MFCDSSRDYRRNERLCRRLGFRRFVTDEEWALMAETIEEFLPEDYAMLVNEVANNLEDDSDDQGEDEDGDEDEWGEDSDDQGEDSQDDSSDEEDGGVWGAPPSESYDEDSYDEDSEDSEDYSEY